MSDFSASDSLNRVLTVVLVVLLLMVVVVVLLPSSGAIVVLLLQLAPIKWGNCVLTDISKALTVSLVTLAMTFFRLLMSQGET